MPPLENPGTRTPRPAYDLAVWRRGIPILESSVPLNDCSQAPQSEWTRSAAEAYLDSWNRDGMDWDRWMEEVELAKAEFAGLIHASPEEIAVCTSVSGATASLASALDLAGRRRKVVVSGAEFPSVGHVWLAHRKYGAQIEWVPVEEGGIEAQAYDGAIDERTRVVSACHAYYQNGSLQDIRSIADRAHAAGAWLFVDAYQTLGVQPLDVRELGADFLAAGNLKYLMGVPGIAFLYVRRELIEELHPAVRLAPHFYNTPEEIDFALDALTGILRGTP